MMSHALGLLDQVTQSFAVQVDGAIEELATSIEASVLSLASSRAGMAIDAVPEAFLQRIKTLANRIHSSATHPIVRLNPLDLLVLKPILEQSQDLLNLRLVSDVNLQRGDIDLSLEESVSPICYHASTSRRKILLTRHWFWRPTPSCHKGHPRSEKLQTRNSPWRIRCYEPKCRCHTVPPH